MVCNKPGVSDVHHVRTRGAGGLDIPENLMSLCRVHHVEVHKIGVLTFYRRYKVFIDGIRSIYDLPKLKRGRVELD